MLSHALHIMGAVYYLCFKTFEGTGVGYYHNASVKSPNMSKLGLQRSNQMESNSWQRGPNRMLDRLAMTNVNQSLSVSPIELEHSWTFQLLNPK